MDIGKDTLYTSSIPETLEKICNLVNARSDALWFRGQCQDNPLIPSLIRLAKPVYNSRGLPFENFNRLRGAQMQAPSLSNLLENFKNHAGDHFLRKPTNDIEWLFLMQHYGLPTNLLDWTKDPMVAIFFATNISDQKIDKLIDTNNYAVIWCISPISANNFSSFVNKKDMYYKDSPEVFEYLSGTNSPLSPIFIEAEQFEDRLIVQKGVFSIHGSNWDSLENMYRYDDDTLFRLIIKPQYIGQIRDTIRKFGYTNKIISPNDDKKYSIIKKDEIEAFKDYLTLLKKKISTNE